MESKYKPRSGDRSDGRLIHSLSGFYKFIPYIMKDRSDSQNFYEQAFEISAADHWFKEQRAAGYKGMGMLHLFIAAYIRCISQLPGLNRFVVGRKIYARDNIEVVMAVKRGMSAGSAETTIKVEFDPNDTVYDVYNKMNSAINDVKTSEKTDETTNFADKLSKLPRFLVRFIVWLIGVADYFGLLPKKLLDLSPFHGSMIITDLGSLGIGPVYHHIYNFGTLPVFISFGAKRHAYELDQRGTVVERKYVDTKFALDERIVDGYYYASVFKLMNLLIQNPSELEIPPEIVKEDIF